MEPDVAMVEDGGKSDFHYGRDWQIMGQPPTKVDRVLRDGDQVRLGEALLIAHNTPGHTRGATTWETTLVDGGRAYHVVWPDGGGSIRAIASARSRRLIQGSTRTTAARITFRRCSSRTFSSGRMPSGLVMPRSATARRRPV
jgi:metallo-beta-lactamase class B